MKITKDEMDELHVLRGSRTVKWASEGSGISHPTITRLEQGESTYHKYVQLREFYKNNPEELK